MNYLSVPDPRFGVGGPGSQWGSIGGPPPVGAQWGMPGQQTAGYAIYDQQNGLTGDQPSDVGVINGVQSAWDSAQKANAQRFKRIMQLAKTFGASALRDNALQTKHLAAQAGQDLISRGLGNSSVRSTVISGIKQRGKRNAGAIKEQRAGLRMNALQQQQDQYPNLAAYAQLLGQPRANNGLPTTF